MTIYQDCIIHVHISIVRNKNKIQYPWMVYIHLNHALNEIITQSALPILKKWKVLQIFMHYLHMDDNQNHHVLVF